MTTASEQIAALGTGPRPVRWRAESDGDAHAKTFYVVNSFTSERRECGSLHQARKLAAELNTSDASHD